MTDRELLEFYLDSTKSKRKVIDGVVRSLARIGISRFEGLRIVAEQLKYSVHSKNMAVYANNR